MTRFSWAGGRGLILQDEDGVWAEFSAGFFSSDAPAVKARLAEVEDVTEVEPEDEGEADVAPGDDEGDGLDSRTVADLRGYADEYGIDLGDATRKGDIVTAIRAHFAALP